MDNASPGAAALPVHSAPDGSVIRWKTADLLQDRADIIVADTVAIFPFSGPQRLDTSYCVRLGDLLMGLVVDAVRAGRCEARSGAVAELVALINERSVSSNQFFTFVYLALTTTLDEVSLDPQLGAMADPWPRVSASVRRAVFDVLAAWTTRTIDSPTEAAITDTLTTLYTKPVFDAAVQKECQRSERFEHWLSIVLIDVDHLADINRLHGYGVGDRVLERLGILLRSYYRQQDWVARYAEDTIAVLLPETAPADALSLAERTRTMVQDRLTFRDHRTDRRAVVTVSVAVVSGHAAQGAPIDAQTMLDEARARIADAKARGRNRVEQVEIKPLARPRTDP